MRSLWLLVVVSACGGKIVELPERDSAIDMRSPSSSQAPAAKTEESPPPGSTPAFAPAPPPAPKQAPPTTSLEACTQLCDRDARCDTTLPALPTYENESGDCDTRCRLKLETKCGVDDWLFCYAKHIDPTMCTPLPPECRPAFCAWARCAEQPVSNCE